MINWVRNCALGAVLALAVVGQAAAQNLSLRAPDWATSLIGADITPTTGGRAVLQEEGVVFAARVTIMPVSGGVARVIRYEQRADGAHLFLRRFTGHPSTGWWLWASDAPRITNGAAAQTTELTTLARNAMGVGGALGGAGVGEVCQGGERIFVEIVLEGRSVSLIRNCAAATDAAGRLALRLSELAGSRDEEELAHAAVDELMAADRDFAAKARTDGVPAAFAAFAAHDALMLSGETPISGQEAIVADMAGWPQGARLEWAPEAGRVSERGDMGWTWGNFTRIGADGARSTGRYITIWKRDLDGNWRYAFDGRVR